MMKRIRTLLVTLIMSVGILGSSLCVYAEVSSDTMDFIKENVTVDEYNNVVIKDRGLEKYITTNPDLGTTPIVGLETNLYVMDDLDADLEDYVNKRIEASHVDEKINNLTGDLKIGADTETASQIIKGLLPVVSTALGFVVIFITTGMTIFSAFDLCYIAFPVFRNKCEDAKAEVGMSGGKGNALAKSNGSGTKLRFVSDDAVYAVSSTETAQTGKNPFLVYFGKRLISYVVLAVLLFILMTDNITVFTDIAIKAVSGILEVIQGI